MAQWRSIIRPAPGGDGPFTCTTESIPANGSINGGIPSITNVTLGLANIGAALDQAKTDGAALLGSLTVQQIITITIAT